MSRYFSLTVIDSAFAVAVASFLVGPNIPFSPFPSPIQHEGEYMDLNGIREKVRNSERLYFVWQGQMAIERETLLALLPC